MSACLVMIHRLHQAKLFWGILQSMGYYSHTDLMCCCDREVKLPHSLISHFQLTEWSLKIHGLKMGNMRWWCTVQGEPVTCMNQEIFTVRSVANSQNDRFYGANVMDVLEGIRLHFVTRSQLGWLSGLLLHQMSPKSPLISIKEGGNVYNKVYSASAGRKCVSLLTEAFGNNYVFS